MSLWSLWRVEILTFSACAFWGVIGNSPKVGHGSYKFWQRPMKDCDVTTLLSSSWTWHISGASSGGNMETGAFFHDLPIQQIYSKTNVISINLLLYQGAILGCHCLALWELRPSPASTPTPTSPSICQVQLLQIAHPTLAETCR